MLIPAAVAAEVARKALWHLRAGGPAQVALWWCRSAAAAAPGGGPTGAADPPGPRAGHAQSPKRERSEPRRRTPSTRGPGRHQTRTLTDGQLTDRGYPMPAAEPAPPYEPVTGRALYMVHNALPFHSRGYATRTHALLTELNRTRWNVTPVTRLGYPYDVRELRDIPDIALEEQVDGLTYRRLIPQRRLELRRPLLNYTERCSDALTDLAAELRPQVLHAASNYVNGLSAALAARRLGLPSVYEVRGLWEITRSSREPAWAASDDFAFQVRMEADACRAADHVFALTGALKSELVDRGVEAERISVLSNGVDVERFVPTQRNTDLADRLGIGDAPVIGYVGSLLDYEGLDQLIAAADLLRTSHAGFHVLIVGDGPMLPQLQAEVERRGLQGVVRFTGRVPHAQVEDLYSLIDIAPFPRLPLQVCHMVSPLKPFEAMAMAKAVVVSDVRALTEIVEDGATGLVHEAGSPEALAHQLRRLLEDPQLRASVGRRARQWVADTHSWRVLAAQVADVYDGLT